MTQTRHRRRRYKLRRIQKSIYQLINTVVTNWPGYSINDLLQTDRDTLMQVLDAGVDRQKETQQNKPVDLVDFVKSL